MFVLTSCILLFGSQDRTPQPQALKTVVVQVGEEAITEAHIQLAAILAGQATVTPRVREQLVKRLVENRLVEEFLREKKISIKRSELSLALKEAKQRIKVSQKIDLRDRLKELGLSEKDVRRELEIGKLWTRYKIARITPDQIRARFLERRQQFDGTSVRVRQVFLKVNDDEAWSASQKKLADLRSQILNKQLTFVDAAKEYSESPSRKDGGDLGVFQYYGMMPPDFSKHAFALKEGEIGQPFRSRYGAHLIKVTKRRAGDLSLEDARSMIFLQLEREEWRRIVESQKQKLPLQPNG